MQNLINEKVLGKREAAQMTNSISIDQLRQILVKEREEKKERLKKLRNAFKQIT